MSVRPRSKKATNEAADGGAASPDQVAARSRSLVFISHDSRDAALAEAFANLLTDVSAGTLKSFRSSDKKATGGIEFGAEWYAAIMAQLSDATDVVALLTPRSVDRPWILYEAGVAKGKLNATVLGVALGVPLDRVSTGPFGQFQNSGDDEESLTKLVMQLLSRNPEASPRTEAVQRQVRVFVEEARKLLADQGSQPSAAPMTEEQSAAKLFEEIKAMVRDLSERSERRLGPMSKRGVLRRGRFHPMMLEELVLRPHHHANSTEAAARWLVFISLFKDDMPWVYEAGLDVYRALQHASRENLEATIKQFEAVLRQFEKSPLIEDVFMPHDEDMFFTVRHLPELTDRFLSNIRRSRKRLVGDAQATSSDDPAIDGS